MHISEEFISYEDPTFIVVADRAHATLYHAHKREWTDVETLENDRLPIEDTERYTIKTGTDHFAKAQDEKLEDREARNFYKKIADELFHQYKQKSYQKLIICIPEHDKNVLVDELHESVKHAVEHIIPRQLTKISTQEILEACNNARNPKK